MFAYDNLTPMGLKVVERQSAHYLEQGATIEGLYLDMLSAEVLDIAVDHRTPRLGDTDYWGDPENIDTALGTITLVMQTSINGLSGILRPGVDAMSPKDLFDFLVAPVRSARGAWTSYFRVLHDQIHPDGARIEKFPDVTIPEAPALSEKGKRLADVFDSTHLDNECIWNAPELIHRALTIGTVRTLAAVPANIADHLARELGWPGDDSELLQRIATNGGIDDPDLSFYTSGAEFTPTFTRDGYVVRLGGMNAIWARAREDMTTASILSPIHGLYTDGELQEEFGEDWSAGLTVDAE